MIEQYMQGYWFLPSKSLSGKLYENIKWFFSTYKDYASILRRGDSKITTGKKIKSIEKIYGKAIWKWQ